jgi:hypothetical protein
MLQNQFEVISTHHSSCLPKQYNNIIINKLSKSDDTHHFGRDNLWLQCLAMVRQTSVAA